ncbi:MAG: D-alanyl-D-alanine carboxypeptidase family protein [Stappiaceae bacterium]
MSQALSTIFDAFRPGRLALGILAMLIVMVPARADIGAWLILDAETGRVLDKKNAFRKWYPASLTKMMTAYVVFSAIRSGQATPDSIVIMSKSAAAEPPSKMGFPIGTEMTVGNALKMLLVKSANDVAVALGQSIGGSKEDFVRRMNSEAERLGMSDTFFTNPHGLPDNAQVTSARDMAILARALWRDFPQYREYYAMTGVQFGKRILKSANREYLLRVEGAAGIKTGYICNSGYNVAAVAQRGGRTLIAIILGAGSGTERAAFASKAINAGFRKGRFSPEFGASIETMQSPSGNLAPPADGYCRRNKLSTAQLYSIYAKPDASKADFASLSLAYAQPEKGSGAVEVVKLPKKKGSRKTDWAKVMDVIVGPRQGDNRILKVAIGIPPGAQFPVASQGKTYEELTGVYIPVPGDKPEGPLARMPTIDDLPKGALSRSLLPHAKPSS